MWLSHIWHWLRQWSIWRANLSSKNLVYVFLPNFWSKLLFFWRTSFGKTSFGVDWLCANRFPGFVSYASGIDFFQTAGQTHTLAQLYYRLNNDIWWSKNRLQECITQCKFSNHNNIFYYEVIIKQLIDVLLIDFDQTWFCCIGNKRFSIWMAKSKGEPSHIFKIWVFIFKMTNFIHILYFLVYLEPIVIEHGLDVN